MTMAYVRRSCVCVCVSFAFQSQFQSTTSLNQLTANDDMATRVYGHVEWHDTIAFNIFQNFALLLLQKFREFREFHCAVVESRVRSVPENVSPLSSPCS